MSVSVYDLPLEIIALILLDLDKASLSSVLRTASFLRPHAEYLLYRRVDLHEGQMSYQRTVDFLTTATRNPRLGKLVSAFYPHIMDYSEPHAGEFMDLLTDATTFFPNLETLMLVHQQDGFPKCLQWTSSQAPPFQLQRIVLHLHCGITHTATLFRDLLQVLQRQSTLFHIALGFYGDDHWGSCIPLSENSGAQETICPSLDILEGTNAAIRLLLPKRRVKSLLWGCERSYRESLRPVHDLETDPRLRDSFFTPELCEAYGRLENLIIYDQISLLPILSTFLSSLRTLQFSVRVPMNDTNPSSAHWDEALFMRAIGEIENLEVLEVDWLQDSGVELDPKVIFATCRKLKHFSLKDRDSRIMYSASCMERGTHGVDYSVTHGTSPNLPYLENGWFIFGTEDEDIGRYLT